MAGYAPAPQKKPDSHQKFPGKEQETLLFAGELSILWGLHCLFVYRDPDFTPIVRVGDILGGIDLELHVLRVFIPAALGKNSVTIL